MAEKYVQELPDECWELIFKLSNLSPLSLVCKQFLSVTNGILLTLKISNPAVEAFLPRLFQRFRSLKRIDMAGYDGDVNSVLHQIAVSGLDLESLNHSNLATFPAIGLRSLGGSKTMKLKRLNCANIRSLGDSELNLIADLFPCLEELDISNIVDEDNSYSDSGIVSLSLKLKSLRKIKLSDNSFASTAITLTGIAKLISHCPCLNSISAYGNRLPDGLDIFPFQGSLTSHKALSVIDLQNFGMSDEFLHKVAEARFPLKKLILCDWCESFTFSGISTLLEEYQHLEHLDLSGADFLTDKNMAELCRFLHSIKHIDLSYCEALTSITFFSLTRNCVNLNEIKMRGTNIRDESIENDLNANHTIKSLHLAGNQSMGNGFLKSVASICPNLERLNLSNCNGLTHEGIVEILRRCSEIRELEVSYSAHDEVMKNFMIDFEVPKLEVLCLAESGIDDDGLAMIGNRCCRLLKLNLAFNWTLTSKGVKEVVENCRELEEIDLTCCDNVSKDIVHWMVLARPSLKKINPPRPFDLLNPNKPFLGS